MSFIFPKETILENICESAAGCLMKGQSKLESRTRRQWHYPFLAVFPQPSVQDQTEGRASPLELPGDSLAPPGSEGAACGRIWVLAL